MRLLGIQFEHNVSVSLPNDQFNTHWVYPPDSVRFENDYVVPTRSVNGILVSFQEDSLPIDVELVDHKTFHVHEDGPLSFIDRSGDTHYVSITEGAILPEDDVLFLVGDIPFFRNFNPLYPLVVTKQLVFNMAQDFPRESRNTDFTTIFEYTSHGVDANVDMFNKASFVLPDTHGITSTAYVEYNEREALLNGFASSNISDPLFPAIQNVNLNCLCTSNDDVTLTATRTRYDHRIMVHNVRFVQGLFSRTEDNTALQIYDIQSTDNVFIGTQSGYNNVGGEFNVFVGNKSGENNIQGSKNAFLGYRAGAQNVSGEENVFLGTEAGFNNRSGAHNILMGYQSGYKNTTGNYNIFMGYKSGYHNTTGRNNVFMGRRAGFLNTTGDYNVFIGDECGYYNVTGSGSTIIGTNTKGALPDPNVDFYANFAPRSAIPDDDDDDEAPPPTIIQNFISVFTINPSANVDTAIRGTTGSFNTVLGVGSGDLFYQGTGLGNKNTMIGSFSGEQANLSNDNTYVGYQAGRYLETSDKNTFVGSFSGGGNVALPNTTQHQTAIGYRSGYKTTNAYNNVNVGIRAGSYASNITDSIFIGNNTGSHNSNATNNVFVGHSTGSNVEGSNNILIGNGLHDNPARTTLHNTINIGNTIVGDLESGNVHVTGGLSCQNGLFVNDGGIVTSGHIHTSSGFLVNDQLVINEAGEFLGDTGIINGSCIEGSIDINGTIDASDGFMVNGNVVIDDTGNLGPNVTIDASKINGKILGSTIEGNIDINGIIDASDGFKVNGNVVIDNKGNIVGNLGPNVFLTTSNFIIKPSLLKLQISSSNFYNVKKVLYPHDSDHPNIKFSFGESSVSYSFNEGVFDVRIFNLRHVYMYIYVSNEAENDIYYQLDLTSITNIYADTTNTAIVTFLGVNIDTHINETLVVSFQHDIDDIALRVLEDFFYNYSTVVNQYSSSTSVLSDIIGPSGSIMIDQNLLVFGGNVYMYHAYNNNRNEIKVKLKGQDEQMFFYLNSAGVLVMELPTIRCKDFFNEQIVVRDTYNDKNSVRRVTINEHGIQLGHTTQSVSIIPDDGSRKIDLNAASGNITADGFVNTASGYNVNGTTVIDANRRLINVYPTGSIYEFLKGRVQIEIRTANHLDRIVTDNTYLQTTLVETNRDLPHSIDFLAKPTPDVDKWWYYKLDLEEWMIRQQLIVELFSHRHAVATNTVKLILSITSSFTPSDAQKASIRCQLIYKNPDNTDNNTKSITKSVLHYKTLG